MNKKRVFVAGHNGMVGSAIARQLGYRSDYEIITAGRSELDLTNQLSVDNFFAIKKIDQIYLAAAKVGGILANSEYAANFIYENIMIQANVINAAHLADINKLLFLGSSCIYPKFAPQPMNEKYLLSGVLEPTNEPYAVAKIAGIKLCESYNRQYGRDYRCVMPTNLYGEGDNFHQTNSHVVPALIRKFHEAKSSNADFVTAWGTGTPKREFLHVDDMAVASIQVMNLDKSVFDNHVSPMNSHINIGTGSDVTIRQLTEMIAGVVGFKGEIRWDSTKPDGAPRKLLDCNLISKLGWNASISLKEGLEKTYEWFLGQDDYRR